MTPSRRLRRKGCASGPISDLQISSSELRSPSPRQIFNVRHISDSRSVHGDQGCRRGLEPTSPKSCRVFCKPRTPSSAAGSLLMLSPPSSLASCCLRLPVRPLRLGLCQRKSARTLRLETAVLQIGRLGKLRCYSGQIQLYAMPCSSFGFATAGVTACH